MNLKQAIERIEKLERRVRELESRPHVERHYYYQTPPLQPFFPSPVYDPYRWVPPMTPYCSVGYGGNAQ